MKQQIGISDLVHINGSKSKYSDISLNSTFYFLNQHQKNLVVSCIEISESSAIFQASNDSTKSYRLILNEELTDAEIQFVHNNYSNATFLPDELDIMFKAIRVGHVIADGSKFQLTEVLTDV